VPTGRRGSGLRLYSYPLAFCRYPFRFAPHLYQRVDKVVDARDAPLTNFYLNKFVTFGPSFYPEMTFAFFICDTPDFHL
jgi:hypothetical protein